MRDQGESRVPPASRRGAGRRERRGQHPQLKVHLICRREQAESLISVRFERPSTMSSSGASTAMGSIGRSRVANGVNTASSMGADSEKMTSSAGRFTLSDAVNAVVTDPSAAAFAAAALASAPVIAEVCAPGVLRCARTPLTPRVPRCRRHGAHRPPAPRPAPEA